MNDDPVLISPAMRGVIEKAIRETCEQSDWRIWALNVRTNHVHIVVTSDVSPERTMSTLKAWATRRLREAKLVRAGAKVWTRHGSTQWLNTDEDVRAACRYTSDGQGPDLPKE